MLEQRNNPGVRELQRSNPAGDFSDGYLSGHLSLPRPRHPTPRPRHPTPRLALCAGAPPTPRALLFRQGAPPPSPAPPSEPGSRPRPAARPRLRLAAAGGGQPILAESNASSWDHFRRRAGPRSVRPASRSRGGKMEETRASPGEPACRLPRCRLRPRIPGPALPVRGRSAAGWAAPGAGGTRT